MLELDLTLFGCVLFVTYALSASVLLAPLRMAFAVRSQWRRNLIYCPVCTGTWVAVAFASIAEAGAHDGSWLFRGVTAWVIVLIFKTRLTCQNYAAEWAVLDAVEASETEES